MLTKKKKTATVLIVIALLCNTVFTSAQRPSPSQTPRTVASSQTSSLTVRDIMAEPSIAGMRPEGRRISPDGSAVAFLWSATGREPRDLYIAQARTGGAPRLLVRAVDEPQQTRPATGETRDEARTDEAREERTMQRDRAQTPRPPSVSGVEWSPDGRRILFSKAGDLFIVNVEGAARPRRLTRTAAPEAPAQWIDARRVLYQSGGNLFVFDTEEASLTQLTRESVGVNVANNTGSVQLPSPVMIFGAQPSPDGARVAYISADTSRQRNLIVPNYTGEFVTAPTFRRGWSEQSLFIVNSSGEGMRPTRINLPAPEGVSYIRGVRWMPQSSAIVVDRIDRDTKRRQIFLASVTDNQVTLVNEETGPKWIAPLSRIIEPSPTVAGAILFASERDGFNHLYLAEFRRGDPGGYEVRQLTRGRWEINWANWTQDGASVVYSSTQDSTAERHFYLLDVRTGEARRLPTPAGMNVDPQLSKTNDVIAFEHSEWNVPGDLYTMRACLNCGDRARPVRLTDTVPARFRSINWTRPQFIEFRSQDGKQIPARIYLPQNFDRARRYPLAVFVHGAGYLQNVINGWNNYYREAMFHHILNERGYVVLDIDYRGSAGYGRDFRTDVHDFLGGHDYQDHLDGIAHAVQNFSVDPQRVGVYGGSYGGFMAEMLAMRAPDRVACAAALRPVADWRNYYASSPIYTAERLGFPDRNPEAYRRSSPISYANELRRPLLLLHGMVDDNVHFQDTVQLVQRLIDLGKTEYFEVMFYPRENHTFQQPEGWADEYERILRFFDRHLRASG
jgi:dipeptidyl aminopeptidase/acylaminoacyl peptidase